MKLSPFSRLALFLILFSPFIVLGKLQNYQIVDSIPHDKASFTQGLQWYQGVFYESTGLYGSSSLRKIDPTGQVIWNRKVDDKYFAEGLYVTSKNIFQLTWKSGVVFVYDRNSFNLVSQNQISGEGWGLTGSGSDIFQSNGSDTIFVRELGTFKIKRKIPVLNQGKPVLNINELEWINGLIWANIWRKPIIVAIEPKTGNVLFELDLSSLSDAIRKKYPGSDVLNGIAWSKPENRIWVTGKLWPNLYEIRLKD